MDIKDRTPTLTKTYKKKIPILWWTQRASHLRFIGRELTSLAVAYVAILILLMIRAASQGEEAYFEFMVLLKSPMMMFFSVFTLGGLFFHSITWFNLAPKALVIKIGKTRIPGLMIALANYIGWVIISVVIVWLFL